MKLVYSQLKKLLPDLSVDPQALRRDLTLIGHFSDGYQKIGSEDVVSLEIRQNRGDCLGYYGLARELSVFYNIPLTLPPISQIPTTKSQLPIAINTSDVKRIQAVKISGVKISDSPSWLKNFLELHQVNSVNNLVDLTNYIMFVWGIPNHAFDTSKTSTNLIWENISSAQEFNTLDGTKLNLQPGNLVVSNPSAVLSLSFLGGHNSGIDHSTTETIIEMAIYNRSRVRSDSRQLKTTTEAAIRLDKELDTETLPSAFSHLISLVLEHCQGSVTSTIFENYAHKPEIIAIPFDPQKPAQYAGINIPSEYSLDCLTRLGCVKSPDGLIPPSIRKDISLEEDLIEEVIRFYGYNKIPLDQPVSNLPLADITPPVLDLIEQLKDKLTALGYDEVRSWPLVQAPLDPKTVVATQNSINSEYPYLRQSMIQSLENQANQYKRLKLENQHFFETGKVFSQFQDKYQEKYSLGIYHHSPDQLKSDLDSLGLVANIQDNYAEIILDNLTPVGAYSPSLQRNKAIELNCQIITLDANVTIEGNPNPLDLIKDYSQKLGPLLWQLRIIDIYQNRYTFRASYYNTDDKTAKELHLKTFGLI